ncbi:hypothetical protein [Acinetobacter bohemicus]|uniref:hypothetical protein n=1 Tax=Acinetobacter bohemicus TaxID=1435036 RepID=UPI0040431E23
MKNLIIGLTVLTTSSLANAVPNFWTNADYQGYDIYIINDSKGQTLSINCNYASSDNADHGVYLTVNNKDYSNSDSSYPLSFLVNDSIVAEPSGTTKWRGGSEKWYTFTSAITKAKKIEIYYKERKISTIIPKNPTLVKSLAKCKSMSDRPKIGG